MPLRSNPTARQQRLGAEVRKMRERAGITARAAAAFLGSSPMYQSHVETGRSGISEDRIRRLAAHCACDDPAYIDALVAVATERDKGWWEGYRGTISPYGLDLAELEYHAVRIQTFQMAHIPGLLQTEDHMRAAFRYGMLSWPLQEQNTAVEFRLRRQQVISTERATPYEAVIHEAALRLRVGGSKAARAQLEHILAVSERSHVTVRVVPFDSEDFAGAGYSMLYLHGPVPQLDTVQMDTGYESVFLDAESRLKEYRQRFERVSTTALSPAASRDLIIRITHEL
ncbi:XRE family transcriptional regulator [Streptomyces ipomoeae]|uniref:XRE family transcriptional regulator n=1 Tax=Streptomyces ipomoeae TaxID=103232 RepID=A0AAE8VSF0_9ACTN|nr:helix-turn-helix transcriptional regulator [Streptomyces ipomoeae]TQE15126.1 XRE family transcriptional regulator [Streptomyces ipomoeae]